MDGKDRIPKIIMNEGYGAQSPKILLHSYLKKDVYREFAIIRTNETWQNLIVRILDNPYDVGDNFDINDGVYAVVLDLYSLDNDVYVGKKLLQDGNRREDYEYLIRNFDVCKSETMLGDHYVYAIVQFDGIYVSNPGHYKLTATLIKRRICGSKDIYELCVDNHGEVITTSQRVTIK